MAALLAACVSAEAGSDVVPCQLTIKGHSIGQLTLVERSASRGYSFRTPGQTVPLPPGEYRVEQVELDGGYHLKQAENRRQGWFRVTREGPNQLVVGAPLYPTVAARRHGRFIQMDYATVDGAGRAYQKTRTVSERMPPEPTFIVYRDGQQVGAGKFQYG